MLNTLSLFCFFLIHHLPEDEVGVAGVGVGFDVVDTERNKSNMNCLTFYIVLCFDEKNKLDMNYLAFL